MATIPASAYAGAGQVKTGLHHEDFGCRSCTLSRSVAAMFFRHSGRALCSEARSASSLGVASSTSASAAFFRSGPQCPHCAACFISSLVFASGRSPAATSNHSASPVHSGVDGDGTGTRIRKISPCTNWCLCSFRLQSWQDSTWRWASLRAGSESCSEPDTLVSLQRNEPIQFVAVEMFVE